MALVVAAPWGHSQMVIQTLNLQPGWNSVYLEVQPAENSPADVFANLPIQSVWTRTEKVTSAEFIQNPAETVFHQGGWLAWLSPDRPDAFLSNLQAVQSHRAYLIKLGGSHPASLVVTGTPSFRRPVWQPNAYTLQGFPVDEAAPPTFEAYFQPSPAHWSLESSPASLEAYRLAVGQWVRVTPTETIQRGQAYWVYTRGASEYAGPLSLTLDLGDGLRFSNVLTELPLRYQNLSPTTLVITVEELVENGTQALSYHRFDPTEGNQWRPLSEPWIATCAAGQSGRIRLAMRRQDFTTDTYASVLRVHDGAGSTWLIPVTAERQSTAVAPGRALTSADSSPPTEAIKRRAGLWYGSATIHAVSEVHSDEPDVPTPTRSTFNLRLLIHLDAAGQARLLKQVIQMWQQGTATPNADGELEVTEPGRYVLLTDDRLIGQFSGAALRDGTPVGRRLSTVGYDFATVEGQHFALLEGAFELGQRLTATLTIPDDSATNPYLHRYHPDHDNRNERFDGPASESYAISRAIEMEFTATPPGSPPVPPDYGYNEMGGLYRETILGLHKQPLRISGTFSLRRISLVAELNPSPNF